MEIFEIQKLIEAQLPDTTKLRPLSGFKMDFSANPGFQKVFFAASCECETAALLSVEISETKSEAEIIDAIPSLVERLVRQEKSFRTMDCSMHSMMRKGFVEGP
ncbi:MAG: hypothetical protein ACJ0BL_01490 [Dehalococcoidia bacterium]